MAPCCRREAASQQGGRELPRHPDVRAVAVHQALDDAVVHPRVELAREQDLLAVPQVLVRLPAGQRRN